MKDDLNEHGDTQFTFDLYRLYRARWNYIKADPDGARALLILLREGKGTHDDFDTMVDRIIESRKNSGLIP